MKEEWLLSVGDIANKIHNLKLNTDPDQNRESLIKGFVACYQKLTPSNLGLPQELLLYLDYIYEALNIYTSSRNGKTIDESFFLAP